MGKSYNCGFRDKRYYSNKKKGAKKDTRQEGDNSDSFNNYKIKHFKG